MKQWKMERWEEKVFMKAMRKETDADDAEED